MVRKEPEKDDHGHKELVQDLKAQRAREAAEKRDLQKEKKAVKAAAKRKKKLEERESAMAAVKEPETNMSALTNQEKGRSRSGQPMVITEADIIEADDDSETGSKRSRKKTKAAVSSSESSSEEETDSVTKSVTSTSGKRTVTVPEPKLQSRGVTSPAPVQRVKSARLRTHLITDVSASKMAYSEGELGEIGMADGESQGSTRPESTRPPSGVKVVFRDKSLIHEGEGEDGSVRLDHLGVASLASSSHEYGASVNFRSRSPTIYSDYGSEWTVVEPEERTQSRLGDFHGYPEDPDQVRCMSGITQHHAKPMASMSFSSPNEVYYERRKRPSSAFPSLATKAEDIETTFNERMRNYCGKPGTDGFREFLHENSGNKFGEKYQEQLIERYHLTRTQRHLRAQSAKNKRENDAARKREVYEQLLGQKQQRQSNSLSQASMLLDEFLSENRPHTAASAPERLPAKNKHHANSHIRAKSAQARVPSMGVPLRHALSLSAAHQHRSPQTQLCSRTKSAVRATSVSELTSSRSHNKVARPKTAPLRMVNDDGLEVSGSNLASTLDVNRSAVLHDLSCAQQLRRQLNREHPFRGRIEHEYEVLEESKDGTDEPCRSSETRADRLRAVDPRNPVARRMRRPTKSIPSKCSKYILVNRRSECDIIVPTSKEEHLIMDRFPEWQEKWIGPKLRYQNSEVLNRMLFCKLQHA